MIANSIYRVFSAIFVVFIIIPFYLFVLMVQAIFNVLNNFTYNNMLDNAEAMSYLERLNIPLSRFWIVKILSIIIFPFVEAIVEFYTTIVSIKF